MNSAFDSNPLPLPLLLLWLAVPGIWLGSGAVLDRSIADRAARRMLRPAVALSGWIVAVQAASMAVHSFWIGMPLGMITLAAAGMALWWRRRSAAASASAGAVATLGESEWRFPRGMWIGMVLTTIPVAVLAFQGYFHDNLVPIGHMSFVAELQNGYFPPRLLGFAGIPLRYHYGFDLVCAGLTALTRFSIPAAISLVTVLGWAYCWCLVWLLGERLTGRREGGLWTAVATMLGGGLAAFVAPFLHGISWERGLTGFYTFGTGTYLNPPFVSYIFQHPFSLGFPLAFALLLALVSTPTARPWPDRSGHGRWSRYWLPGLFLAALSLTQSTLFVSLAATFAFTEIVAARRWRFGAVLAAVFAIAWYMGGMLFTHISNGAPSGLHLAFWPITVAAEHAGDPVVRWSLRILSWHLVTFGVLLPLGIWGLWHVRQLRLALLLLIAGGLAVRLCVAYDYTWDMVKFSTVASLALGLAAGAVLTTLASHRTVAGRAVLTAAVLASTLNCFAWISGVEWILKTGRGPSTFVARPVALSEDDRQSMSWLRTRAKPDELVYRLPSVSLGYFQWGGLSSTPSEIEHTDQFGVPPRRRAQRDQVIAARASSLEPYKAIGIRWFVVGADDPEMLQNVQKWEHDGEVVKKAEFGALQIDAVVEPSASQPLSKSSAASH